MDTFSIWSPCTAKPEIPDRRWTSELWKGRRIADGGAGRKCNCSPGDGPSAAIVLKKVVSGSVFLTAVIEDAYPVASRRDYHIRLPLVGSRSVVVYLGRSAPGGAAVRGLHQKDVRFVSTARGLVVSHINVAAHRINRGVRECIAAEA